MGLRILACLVYHRSRFLVESPMGGSRSYRITIQFEHCARIVLCFLSKRKMLTPLDIDSERGGVVL